MYRIYVRSPKSDPKQTAKKAGYQEEHRSGFDHGVGHPLLLLYDVKAPHGQKSKEFKNLGHYPFNISLNVFLGLNQNVTFVQLFDFSSFSCKALK